MCIHFLLLFYFSLLGNEGLLLGGNSLGFGVEFFPLGHEDQFAGFGVFFECFSIEFPAAALGTLHQIVFAFWGHGLFGFFLADGFLSGGDDLLGLFFLNFLGRCWGLFLGFLLNFDFLFRRFLNFGFLLGRFFCDLDAFLHGHLGWFDGDLFLFELGFVVEDKFEVVFVRFGQ